MTRFNKKKQMIWTYENGKPQRRKDILATEEPMEILLRAGDKQQTVAITMRTPGNDYELAAGFLYNEGILQRRDEISGMTYCVDGNQQEYNSLRIQLKADSMPELKQLERHFFTNSACGVCGSAMLDDLSERNLPVIPAGPIVDVSLITSLPDKLRQSQDLFESTGGLHAAAIFDLDGNLLAVREDVGRHNALDKLIGWGLLNNQLPFHDKVLMVSGRASYELLQKAFVAGVPVFCAVSAPSSLAVQVAEKFGVTLIGFLRGARFNVYTGTQRIKAQAVSQISRFFE
ncbi:MAG: formate dehydrogenase accessory sulfurtransferase FdhD [Anaerolineales bacterium]|nr:formate dehydrogenase accessory sulfurtransferase FdhD [Anaerolineales bacterium]MCB9145359.1 formate dehydrogenase accessory sulfurtransferase FdhD [Anaerolineales bacterium]